MGERMALLSKDAILSASDIAREEVVVTEWGGSVLLRGLTAEEHYKYQLAASNHVKKHGVVPPDYQARLVQMAAIDESGTPIFAEADIPKLIARSGAVITRLAKVVTRLSGLDPEENAEKN
jgi:hypothetical protein